jgi:hypothetical protein
MNATDKTRKIAATAHHEAGHAFADFKFAFKIKKISIIPDSNSGGRVVSRTGLHFRSLEYARPTGARIGRLHEQVVSLLAGHAAQRRHRPSSIRSHHARRDREAVGELLIHLHGENELPHFIRYLEAKAKNLVEHPKHWFVTEHLARDSY